MGETQNIATAAPRRGERAADAGAARAAGGGTRLLALAQVRRSAPVVLGAVARAHPRAADSDVSLLQRPAGRSTRPADSDVPLLHRPARKSTRPPLQRVW